MKLVELSAYGFRNYPKVRYRASAGLNLLVGDNGVGKTNMLDLIHYLATGRSYFSGVDREVVHIAMQEMRIEGRSTDNKIVVKWRKGEGKVLEWNDQPIGRLSDYIGRIKVVMMAPQDPYILQSGNTERRKWVDRLLCQLSSDYAHALRIYHTVLLRRNTYLKQTGRSRVDDALLKIYWEQMELHAIHIFEKRTWLLKSIEPKLQEYYQLLSGGMETVSLDYESDLQQGSWRAIHQILEDIQYQSTRKGVHKDKIRFSMKGGPTKQMASQGQAKSYFLALKLAEYDILNDLKEGTPILLIDDVFSKLDEHRVKQLFDILKKMQDVQVFVTDTHFERMKELLKISGREGRISSITEGVITLLYEEE